MSKTQSVNDSTFQTEVLESDQPVLVDFWAEWCGPCKQVAPILEEIAADFPNVKVVKVNIEESLETPTKYGVRGIPTMMLFQGGEVKSVKVGAMPKSDMADWVNENVA